MRYSFRCFSDTGESTPRLAMKDTDCSRTLALVCGVKTLVMTDLLRPEPGRTRSILSGIMNFAKWRRVMLKTHQLILITSGRISHISSQLCNTKSTPRLRGLFDLTRQRCSTDVQDGETPKRGRCY
jgi:hypothetical protein